MAKRHDPRELPQAQTKHPAPWAGDLEPNRLAGQNIGARSEDVSEGSHYASDIKDLSRELASEFTRDELAQIPVLIPGARLAQDAVYCDISDPHRPVFRAIGDMVVPREHYVIAKRSVSYEHWNRLTGRARA